MKELQRKQRMKQWLYSYPVLILILLICFFLAKGALGVMLKERESARKAADLRTQNEAMINRAAELEASIAGLRTEDGIVEEIREKYSATRKGEFVAIIVDERQSATSTKEHGRAWYKRLWRVIIPKYDK